MYGVIYKAIEQYVVGNFGDTKWNSIKEESAVKIDCLSMEQSYNDNISYQLAALAAKYTNLPIEEILMNFGEYIIKTTSENYSIFIESRGNNMREYLINLPNFHNRMMLIYPELTPPEFRVSDIKNNCLNLHYISATKGMVSYIKGYLNGLMKVFNEKPDIEAIDIEKQANGEYTFKICW